MSRTSRLKRFSTLERSRVSTQYTITRALVRQDERGELENGVKTILELPDNGRAVS